MTQELKTSRPESLARQSEPRPENERVRAAKHHGVGGDPEHLDAEMSDPSAAQGTLHRPVRADAGNLDDWEGRPYATESAMSDDYLPSNVISSDRVEGTPVYSAGNDKLGSIDYLVIDKRSGFVRYAVLEFGGFLGMGTDRYPIPWGILEYDTTQGGYVVPLDKSTLEGAPRHQSDVRPDYSDEYGQEVYAYYGANW